MELRIRIPNADSTDWRTMANACTAVAEGRTVSLCIRLDSSDAPALRRDLECGIDMPFHKSGANFGAVHTGNEWHVEIEKRKRGGCACRLSDRR